MRNLLAFFAKCQRLRHDRTANLERQHSITSFYDIVNRMPLYRDTLIKPLQVGTCYIFNGRILPTCEKFTIAFLLSEDGDTALHINPRLPQQFIVRNSIIKGAWGQAEDSSPLPFSLQRGGSFCIQVLVTEECFMISVNGHHFAEFMHRVHYQQIRIIEVNGDVDSLWVDRRKVTEYPQHFRHNRPCQIKFEGTHHDLISYVQNHESETDDEDTSWRVPNVFRIVRLRSIRRFTLPVGGYSVPFYGRIPMNALRPGRVVKIDGRIKLLPHSFSIDLQRGHDRWPHPVIALHLQPRFVQQTGQIGKAIICRRSRYNNAWSPEIISELNTDLRPGKMFSLAIVCVEDAFEVYLNEKYILEFIYLVQPDIVDMVYIQGDIMLWKVVVENNALTADGTHTIYRNTALEQS